MPPPLDWPVEAPIVSSNGVGYLPGGGEITSTGEYSYQLPIDVPAGRMGMAPSLSLVYSSRGGNGPLGVGWSLAGTSAISAGGKTIAQDGVTTGAGALFLDGGRLRILGNGPLVNGAELITEQDQFARIVFHDEGTAATRWFEVFTKQGTIRVYTPVLAKRVTESGEPQEGFATPLWVMASVRDRSGNATLFHYDIETRTVAPYGYDYRLASVEFTAKMDDDGQVTEAGQRSVDFVYDDRPDSFFLYSNGVRREIAQRLTRIMVHAPYPGHVGPMASYWLTYEQSATTGKSRLRAVTRDDSETSLWTRQFEWAEQARPDFDRFDIAVPPAGSEIGTVADLDGDGVDEWLASARNDDGDSFADKVIVCRSLPGGAPLSDCVTDANARGAGKPGDLDGDGRAEIWARQGNDVRAMRWTGTQFEPTTFVLPQVPGAMPENPISGIELADVDGDGLMDAVLSLPNSNVEYADRAWVVRRNTGSSFGPEETMCPFVGACPFDNLYEGRAMATDLNGDGRAEVLLSWSPADDPDPDSLVNTRFYSVGTNDSGAVTSHAAGWSLHGMNDWLFIDLNGDGLKDAFLASLAGGSAKIRYNTGVGFGPEQVVSTSIDPYAARRVFQVLDLDADGREDLLSFSEQSSSGAPLPHARMHLWRGDHFEAISLAGLGVPAFDPTEPRARVIGGDFNGDGLADLRVSTADRAFVLQQRWEPNDVIVAAWDQHASHPRERVFYSPVSTPEPSAPSAVFPARSLRGGFTVANEHWSLRQDEPSAVRRRAYDFDDPRSDLHGRGFLGFGMVRVLDLDTFAETVTLYDHDTKSGTAYPYAGAPSEIWQTTPILITAPDASGTVLLPPGGAPITARVAHSVVTRDTVSTNGGASYFTYVRHEHVGTWEQHATLVSGHPVLENDGSATPVRVRTTNREVDAFGNETHLSAATQGGASCETNRTFDNLTQGWLIGLLRTSATACSEGISSIVAPPQDPRQISLEYDGRGLLKKTIVEPNRPDLSSTLEHHRLTSGLIYKTTYSTQGQAPRHSFTAYDDEGVFPRAVVDDLGHTRRQLVHPALGVVVLSEDENGVRVTSRFDGFGRPRSVDPEGGMAVQMTYAADHPAAPTGLLITSNSEDNGETTTRLDDAGRPVASETLGFDGQWIHQSVTYNRFGQRTQVYRPGFGQPSQDKTLTTFDTLGRVVSVKGPDSAISTFAHSMFELVSTDPVGRVRRLKRDLDDRVIETADWNDDHWVATTYEYGPWGLLSQVVDAAGNTTSMRYDKVGRRTELNDSDRGRSTHTYNGWSEVLSSTDGMGDTTVFDRDALGRVVWQQHDQDGVTTYEYDGAPGDKGAIGALTRATSPDGIVTEATFDGFGRPHQTRWTIGQDHYDVAQHYDDWGRVDKVSYPEVPGRPRFEVQPHYNALGYLDGLSDVSAGGLAPLWAITGRNADGAITGATAGDSIVEARTYDPVTGRLASVEALVAQIPLYSMEYHHDLSGDLLLRRDNVKAREENFTFDGLDRLETWDVTFEHATRHVAYSYDDLGNLESMTSPEGTETYAHVGQVVQSVLRLPHALTSRAAGGVVSSYAYDAKGRQIGGAGREIEWKGFDLPDTIFQGGAVTRFAYDASGARVRKVRTVGGSTETTLSIGGVYEKRIQADGTVTHLFTVHGSHGPVAQVVYAPGAPLAEQNKTLFFQSDVQGSVGLVLEKAHGQPLVETERRMFDPFGLRTSDSGAPAAASALGEAKLGFTGHRHDDELGLIDMKGRVYDPLQKRFLSADPSVPNPLSGQSLHRYSYVLNNPIRYTDPSGFTAVSYSGSAGGGVINGAVTSQIGCIVIAQAPPPPPPPVPQGEIPLSLGAIPDSFGSPPSSTTDTGPKPNRGPTADPPKSPDGPIPPTPPNPQAAEDSTRGRELGLRRSASVEWFESVSRMQSRAEQMVAMVAMAQAAQAGVGRGAMRFAGKAALGLAANVASLGAVGSLSLAAKVYGIASSDNPLEKGLEAVAELHPTYLIATRLRRFFQAMDDFDFEAAGEALGEAEFIFGAVMAGAVPGLGGAAAAEAEGGATFANQLPGRLAGELSAAGRVGAVPIRAGTPSFGAALNEGTIKWVVTESGELLVTPHTVGGIEISHAVLSGGRPVLAAGQAEIAGAQGFFVGMGITPHSGHFTPSPSSLQIGIDAFAKFGIHF